MEEWVGQQWHRWVLHNGVRVYEESSIQLSDLRYTLNSLLSSLGAGHTLKVQTAWPLQFPHVQTRKMLLTGRGKHALAWLSDDSLYLPSVVDCFPDAQLNQDLYYWWVALAALWPKTSHDWYENNQHALQAVLEKLPGLASRWPRLRRALLAERPELSALSLADAAHEERIQGVLNQSATHSSRLPRPRHFPYPVRLFLYPPQQRDVAQQAVSEEEECERESESKPAQKVKGKKSARRVTESDEKNGLLLFRLENLFTVTDWLNIQRPEEDDEDASTQAAHELDVISLSHNTSTRAAKVRFDLDLPAQAVDDLPLHEGILLPEWHYRKDTFLADHCCLVPLLSREAQPCEVPEHLTHIARKIRQQFKQWRTEPMRLRRQLDGSEIDVQAWLDFTTQPNHDSAPAVFVDQPRIHKSRSTLLLADVSQSTESYANDRPIIDGIRDAMMVFSEGLDAINEPFSLYAFSSIRRRQVRFHLLKNPNEPWGELPRGRVNALKPGYYTRMGAAIRQSTAVLLDQPQEQKWLLILTDGKPNDVDHYEHRYGLEDTRKAVLQAKSQGLQVFAITLDPDADEYAPHLFGQDNYHLVTKNENLVDVLPRLFRQLSA